MNMVRNAAQQAHSAAVLACHDPGGSSGRSGRDLAKRPRSRQSSPQLMRIPSVGQNEDLRCELLLLPHSSCYLCHYRH